MFMNFVYYNTPRISSRRDILLSSTFVLTLSKPEVSLLRSGTVTQIKKHNRLITGYVYSPVLEKKLMTALR